MDENCVAAYRNRSGAYVGVRNFDLAMRDASHAIRLKPDDAGGYASRSQAAFWARDFESAILDANRVLQINPELADGYKLRG